MGIFLFYNKKQISKQTENENSTKCKIWIPLCLTNH